MPNKTKFYICKHCGNLVGLIKDKGVPLVCCGEPMTHLKPNTVEAAIEKHLPYVEKTEKGIKVSIGSVLHPMVEEHYITFVYVETKSGGQRKAVAVGEEPIFYFDFVDDEPTAVYAYCNLHGLWMTTI